LFVEKYNISVFTDGACHASKSGVWASIILMNETKHTLYGQVHATTHQRMELQAVIESLHFLERLHMLGAPITIYSDSQYVIRLIPREAQLKQCCYLTRSGKQINNADLMSVFYDMVNRSNVQFQKVKAHSAAPGEINNREVDMLCRQKLRESIRKG